MPVFVSHSFENEPEFENVTDTLQLRGVPFWHPTEIRSGESLREQLRAAVERCALSIFVATRNSIGSSLVRRRVGSILGRRQAHYRLPGRSFID
jgi:hypothetical protein